MRRFTCRNYAECLAAAAKRDRRMNCSACARFEEEERTALEDPFVTELRNEKKEPVIMKSEKKKKEPPSRVPPCGNCGKNPSTLRSDGVVTWCKECRAENRRKAWRKREVVEPMRTEDRGSEKSQDPRVWLAAKIIKTIRNSIREYDERLLKMVLEILEEGGVK